MTRLAGNPGIFRRLTYYLGFRLPDANREWVRHELTDAGWRLRLVLGHLVIMVPVCVVLALLPGPPWLRIAVPGLALIASLGMVAMYGDDLRVKRLRQYGIDAPVDRDTGRPSH
ncbi:MAG: DUF5313 family protein [Streptosporangiaceae bacterium]|jgi:hypothetical protein